MRGPGLYAVRAVAHECFHLLDAGWFADLSLAVRTETLPSQHFRSSHLQLVRMAAEVQLLGDWLNLIQHPLSHWAAITSERRNLWAAARSQQPTCQERAHRDRSPKLQLGLCQTTILSPKHGARGCQHPAKLSGGHTAPKRSSRRRQRVWPWGSPSLHVSRTWSARKHAATA